MNRFTQRQRDTRECTWNLGNHRDHGWSKPEREIERERDREIQESVPGILGTTEITGGVNRRERLRERETERYTRVYLESWELQRSRVE